MLLGRIILSGAAVAVSAVFIAASASMNYAYLSRQGETPWEGQVFGAVAIAVTLYNAAGFFFIRWGWENSKRTTFVPVCAVFQFVFLTFSLMCALGFAASNRGAVTGSKEALAALRNPACRPAEFARRIEHEHVLGVGSALHPERAADVLGHDADAIGFNLQQVGERAL